MYSVVENISKTKSIFQRRRYYDSKTDWESQGRVEAADPAWFAGWEQRGIDVKSIRDQEPYWQDFETLKYLRQYGSLRFWLDDIWEFDWRALAKHDAPNSSIVAPPGILRAVFRFLFSSLSALAGLRRRASS